MEHQWVMLPAGRLLLQMIKCDDAVIFTDTICSNCHLAEEIFDYLNVPFTIFELKNMEHGDFLASMLAYVLGTHEVPWLFIYGNYIGSFTNLIKEFHDGNLERRLK